MRQPRFSSLFFASALSLLASVPAVAASDFGSIAFVGDSITQGGGAANELSYRYSLWKCFVDNNVDYDPLGSTTIFRSTGSDTSLAKDYLGKSFNNRNEGHYGWRTFWMINGPSGQQANTGSGKLSDWLSNPEYYPDGSADKMTLMLGVNDLSQSYTVESTAAYSKQIVQTYQAANSNVKSYVFSILPTNQSWNGTSSSVKIGAYNAYVKNEIEAGKWGENVFYCDVTTGFDPSVHTKDNVHPNAQGALIVAGNIARALGVGQRTVGQERKAASALSTQTAFAASATTGVSVSVDTTTGQTTMGTSGTAGKWTLNDAGNIAIASGGSTASDLRYQYATATSAHEFTLEVEFRMEDVTSSETNQLGIWCGNGERVGLLYVEENAIWWNYNSTTKGPQDLLYRNSDLSNLFVDEFSTIRMAWIEEDLALGIESGFYVWLGDMLIGEALTGSVLDSYKNSIVIGNTAGNYDTYAEIANIAFDANYAWAPTAIPEPSAFAMLAGLGALAFVGMRRRRK